MSDSAPVYINGRFEKRSFLKDPAIPDAKEKIDRMGELLAKVFACEREKMRLYRELWRIYLADCKRLGVVPRQANTAVM